MTDPVVQPFPWPEILGYLKFRLVADTESVEGSTYSRRVAGGVVTATYGAEVGLLSVTVPEGDPEPHLARLRFLFQHHVGWAAPEAFTADPILGPLVDRVPGLRPLGCWDPFELCLRTIVGQQVSVAAARTLMDKLGRLAGGTSPRAVARADLNGLGMPGRRVATLQTLAARVDAGDINPGGPWKEAREGLSRVPGIGPWTLDYLGIRLGRDLDAFPSTDLGLLRGAGCPTARALEVRAQGWAPRRGWAAACLWMDPGPKPQDEHRAAPGVRLVD